MLLEYNKSRQYGIFIWLLVKGQGVRVALAGQMGGAIHLSLIFCLPAGRQAGFFYIKAKEERKTYVYVMSIKVRETRTLAVFCKKETTRFLAFAKISLYLIEQLKHLPLTL